MQTARLRFWPTESWGPRPRPAALFLSRGCMLRVEARISYMKTKEGLLYVSALAFMAIVITSPALAQAVGFATDPTAMIGGFARGCLAAMGAVITVAGGYKGVQVWSGHRDFYQAATWLLGGAALGVGTAAIAGFA